LQPRHGYDQRVSVLGYTTQMRDLLRAAAVFVTTTAGSSMGESLRPLTEQLSGALREGPHPIPAPSQLPTAAELTVALARPHAEMTG
jgi:hypothetical protein